MEYLDELKNSRILITGGTGFIAHQIALLLLINNDIKHCNNTIVLLARNLKKLKLIFGDLLKRDDIKLLIQDVREEVILEPDSIDYIIHAAFPADPQYFEKDPIGICETAIDGTKQVIKLAKKQKVKSVVYISSITVYGDIENETEIEEDYVGKADWKMNRACYVQGKRMAELICFAAFRNLGIPIKILRPGYVYGCCNKEDTRVYAEIIRNVADNQNVVLKTAGLVYRDMVYVSDLVRAILCVMLKGENGEAYNVANEYISIRQFAEIAVRDSQSRLEYVNSEDRMVEETVEVIGKINSDKIRACGWEPEVSIEQGIQIAKNTFLVKEEKRKRNLK